MAFVGLVLAAVMLVIGWSFGRLNSTLNLPITTLHAAASDSTENVVIATGLVTEEIEGLFALDGLSGDLQCTVFNPNAQQFNTVFRTNVVADLQLDATKNPRFLMVTGNIETMRRSNRQVGGCLVYVVEASSGHFAAYAVPWRRDMFLSGRPQAGDLVLLQRGSIRTAVVRE